MCQVPSAASVPTTVPVPSQEDGSTVWCKDLFTDEKGKWLGLLVQEKHASKFFAEEGQRKTHEVRTRQVKFLKPNDKIALIAVNPRGDKAYRKILGTLKFEGNVAIPRSSFNDFFPKHQVTMDELDKISRGKKTWASETLWGWHFTVLEALQPPPLLKVSACNRCNVIWTYFSLDDIVVQNLRESSAFPFLLCSETVSSVLNWVYLCCPCSVQEIGGDSAAGCSVQKTAGAAPAEAKHLKKAMRSDSWLQHCMIILRTQVAVSEIWMTSCIYCGRYILMRWTHNHLTMRRSLDSLHSLVNFKNKKTFTCNFFRSP